MDGKDLKELLEEQMRDMEVPDSLRPENVEQLLNQKRKTKRRYYRRMLAAAACCILVVGAAAAGAFTNRFEAKSSKESMARPAGKMEEAQKKTDDVENLPKETVVAAIRTAKDYKEIFTYVQVDPDEDIIEDGMSYMETEEADGAAAEGGAQPSSIFNSSAGADLSYTTDIGSREYSDTNVREEGVKEADIVKTDGKNLYAVSGGKIQIVSVEQDNMELLSTIDVGSIENHSVNEIYVKDDKLVVAYNQVDYGEAEDLSDYKHYAVAETFDISDARNPRSIGRISQSGIYHSLRAVGDYVYILSNFYVDSYNVKESVYSGYIPEVQGKYVECGDILMPEEEKGNEYTVVSAFSLENPGEKTDTKAIFGSSGMCYVSGKNIYVTEVDYRYDSDDVTKTCIRKVSYENGILTAVGQAEVEGMLKDSFCIDEYNGNLRLVTTLYSSGGGIMPLGAEDAAQTNEKKSAEVLDTNSLIILDEELNELSRIDGLAPNERIYSARFMGDTGYFVTYRQMDPLFSVDLSDPAAPKILGELKIPGFSEYLHPYGDGLLLGIGFDTDETGTTTNGVKLSMFDISDPSNVQEIHKYVINEAYSADAIYNYKAVFVDVEKSMIGFAAYGERDQYYIFSYGENGFSPVFERDITGTFGDGRALYVRDKFYLFRGNTIESFRMDTFDKVDDIVL